MNSHRDSEPSLEARLRADARRTRVAPPDGLELRISAAVWRDVDNARRAPSPTHRRFRFFSPTLAGLVTSACAIAAVVLWQGRTSRSDDSAAEIRYLVDTMQTLSGRLAAAELPIASRIAASDPLSRELASVRSDARSALGFLAANFLPSQVLANDNESLGTLPQQET